MPKIHACPGGHRCPPAGRRLRILVVDDNADVAWSFARLLEVSGHEVVTAADGAGALRAARDGHPDVVLLDLDLPDMDGCEVAKRLRAAEPAAGPVVVAVSGYGEEHDVRDSLAAGCACHLVKPVCLDTLVSVLAGVPVRPRGPDAEAAGQGEADDPRT